LSEEGASGFLRHFFHRISPLDATGRLPGEKFAGIIVRVLPRAGIIPLMHRSIKPGDVIAIDNGNTGVVGQVRKSAFARSL
jgi:hypothetical protein